VAGSVHGVGLQSSDMVSPDDCFGSKRGVRTGCLHTFDKTSEETASKNTSPQRHGDKICCASSEAHSLHFFGPLGHCEFPAIFREGMHRVTVAPQHRKESNADAGRRCTQNTLMLPCGSKTVGHTFDIDGHALPASRHRRSPRPSPHPRVMRASPCCTCVEILTLRCRGPMLAHALPGPRRRTRFWCYTLAWRVYGAALWLRPTPALR
jgi:hypothetical protein